MDKEIILLKVNMKRNIYIVFFSIFLVLCFSNKLHADDDSSTTAEPYTEDEFPQWARDLRRTEIITFGSLPFVTLSTTIVYSFYRYYAHDFSSDYIPNPLASSSDAANLDSSEQLQILLTSVGISAGLGLFDFVLNKIKYQNKKSAQYDNSIIIMTNNNTKLINKENEENSIKATPETMIQSNNKYMLGGMESAIF